MRTFRGLDRRPIAVVVTSDGRRVHMPIEDGSLEVTVLSLIRSLLVGLESLLGLITGSRRGNGGTRNGGRG